MRGKIEKEIEKIRRKYLDSAEEIVSGFRRELELSKDYEGRQIFELLQNADDEAADSQGKVLISFINNTLSVSNTGTPFSFEGVKSLLYPNASPKKIQANKIGCKGLGFRSILTWTDSVLISSSDFSIKFSKDYAISFLEGILKEKPSLKEDIKRLASPSEKNPIATLTCPHILSESKLLDGYATTIIMECHEDLSDEIENQIKSLEFEELIFLPNLKEIEIVCENYHKVFYKITEGKEVVIETDDKVTGEKECANWNIYKKTGVIVDENEENKNYEFIIAYDPSGEYSGEVLYSYFKTDVKLVFPALIHGTFELTSDRNSLQKQSSVNKQLIPMLADFMVQVAVEISEEQEECDYKPLSLVVSSDVDIVLNNSFNFEELLKERIRDKRILPSIDNKYISLQEEPYYSSYEFDEVLNPKVFSTLLQMADNEEIESFLEDDLDIGFYPYRDFCELINDDLDYYSKEKKVSLIGLIEDEYRYTSLKDIFPHLLVDNNGNNICDAVKVYPTPNEEQVIDLPSWVEIKFLNRKMERLINDELGIGKGRRSLVNELNRYNLEEYSFDRLIRGVVNQLDEETTTKEKCLDVLKWLWNYYNSDDCQDIPDVKVKVISRDGEICFAKESYIGKEYGNYLGERLISIYSNNFVSFQDSLDKDSNDETYIGFLEWLGVSKYPRIIKKSLSYDERNDFLDTCYPLYVYRDAYRYSKGEFGPNQINNVTIATVENLDLILDKADFNDLLAWFLLDEEINVRINSETEEKNNYSCIKGYPYKKVDERVVSPEYIQSYIRYILSTKSWIPDKDGEKTIPLYCCFEDNNLAPFITVPNIDYSAIREIVGRKCSKKEIDAILGRIGVSDSFQDMDKSVVYQVFMKLPELDSKYKKAKSLYRKIIREGLAPEEYQNNNPAFRDFIENGKVLVKEGGIRRYALVSEARYADKKVFSDEILKKFKMFDVDARSGEEKIKKLFGVKPLKMSNVEIVGKPKLHSLNQQFKKEYLQFLPFVFACRLGLKTANSDFNKLQLTKVYLCSELTIKYDYGQESVKVNLKDYENVYLKNNIAYLCAPESFDSFENLKNVFEFADSVSELITAILDVNEDKDFYRDLFRDSILVREKKMRADKGDDNLELLTQARHKFNTDLSLRDEFWLTIAEVMKIPNNRIESSSSEEIIHELKLKDDIDSDVIFDDLSCEESIKALVRIFEELGIDIEKYNASSNYFIDTTKYWKKLLLEKMKVYKTRYQAYLVHEYRDEENCVELYCKFMEEYNYPDPEINNSLFIDVDKIFENECGVSFKDLDEYKNDEIDILYKEKKNEVSSDAWNQLKRSYSQSDLEAYLLFGKINDLNTPMNQEEPAEKQETYNDSENNSLNRVLNDVLNGEAKGFSNIGTKKIDNSRQTKENKKKGGNPRLSYNEITDRKKQEIGLVGEAFVFHELIALYDDVRWVSGNAEKAGRIDKGDDTCGYDIRYKDEDGNVQYVEVKSSKSEDITFYISDKELRFACDNADNYEIIYVLIGEDGKPSDKPFRLGHLFAFGDGEDLFHNERFSIESDNYCIAAKKTEG